MRDEAGERIDVGCDDPTAKRQSFNGSCATAYEWVEDNIVPRGECLKGSTSERRRETRRVLVNARLVEERSLVGERSPDMGPRERGRFSADRRPPDLLATTACGGGWILHIPLRLAKDASAVIAQEPQPVDNGVAYTVGYERGE